MQHQAVPGELLEAKHRAGRGSSVAYGLYRVELLRIFRLRVIRWLVTPPLETHFDPNGARSTAAAGPPRTQAARVGTPMACFVRAMSLLLLVTAAEGFQKPSERMPSDLHGPRPLPDDPDALAAVQQY